MKIGKLFYVFILSLFLMACFDDSSDNSVDSMTQHLSSSALDSELNDHLLEVCFLEQSAIFSPQLLPEVYNGPNADLCDFNRFAVEGFLYLMMSSDPNDPQAKRRFQIDENYPIYQGEEQDSCVGNEEPFFIKNAAIIDTSDGGEVGGIEVYSHEGEGIINVINYTIRFSRDLCMDDSDMLPENLIEMKLAWRFLPETVDQSRYLTYDVTYNGETMTFGLIGFHLAQSTALHPEMVWSTWEHIDNSPDCVPSLDSPDRPENGWTMTTDTCATCLLVAPYIDNDCTKECTNREGIALNQGRKGEDDPLDNAAGTNVCQLFPYGIATKDFNYHQNRINIKLLNYQVVKALNQLDSSHPQYVLQYYPMVGGTWFAFDKKTGTVNNRIQGGSLRLANTVMETAFQGKFTPGSTPSTFTGRSCMTCHNDPSGNYTATSHGLVSHIARYIKKNRAD